MQRLSVRAIASERGSRHSRQRDLQVGACACPRIQLVDVRGDGSLEGGVIGRHLEPQVAHQVQRQAHGIAGPIALREGW